MSAYRKRILFGVRRLSLRQVQVLAALATARKKHVTASEVAYVVKRRLDDVHEALVRMRDLVAMPFPGYYRITKEGVEILKL